MANQLFINDRTNPLLLPARPVSGGDINWDSQVGQPGLSPIFADFTSELQKLYIETDATIVGKGIKENNIANLAVLPQNQREIINTPYKNKITISQLTQIDGQALNKKILLPPFQAITNFRNFQTGVDNVTTELDVQIKNLYIQPANGVAIINNNFPYFGDGANIENYTNIKINVEVDSTSAFTSPTLIHKEGFFGILTNPNGIDYIGMLPWNIKVVDKLTKAYQNPWIRVYLTLEKTILQPANVSMTLDLRSAIDCTYKCKNKHI
jgi:hypothetical protein